MYLHIKNNKLMRPYKYQFGKKKLYIIDIKKYTFTDENIENILIEE